MISRIFLVFIALHFSSLSANAQAGFLFPHDTSAIFFDHGQEKYFSAYIDSSSIEDMESHLHFKGDFGQDWTSSLCWDTYCEAGNTNHRGFGAHYTASADSTHRFLNNLGDSLVFDFNLEIGESSLFHANELHYFITRLYDSSSENLMEGETVWNYEITAMLDYQETFTPFSGQIISIGEHMGLRTFFDIQQFPETYSQLELVGHTHYELGMRPFTFADAFDFQLAEIYQFHKSSNSPGSYSSSTDTYTIMSRSDSEWSVTYQIQKESTTTLYMADYDDIIPPEIIVHTPVTTEHTYYKEEIGPHLYGPRYKTQGISGYSVFDTTNNFGELKSQITLGLDAGYYACDENPDCFFLSEFPEYGYKKYIPGLGKVYEYSGTGNYGWSEELTYFEKEGLVWGNDVTSVDNDHIQGAQIMAFPNPSSGIVQLSSPVQNARLYDARGQMQEIVNGSSINLTAFAEGLYLLKTSEGDQTLRIVKQ